MTVVPTGPHNASLTVTPPAVGGPFSVHNITVCIAASSSPADCFTTQCTPAGAGACTVDVGAASCAALATNCLRANTTYAATALAVSQSGAASLASAPAATFTTPLYR